jgi:hypothetical protein
MLLQSALPCAWTVKIEKKPTDSKLLQSLYGEAVGICSRGHVVLTSARSAHVAWMEPRWGTGHNRSRTWPPQTQHQWHTGETQERDQHEAILIGGDGGLLFEMALHQQQCLRFLGLPDRPSLPHQLA